VAPPGQHRAVPDRGRPAALASANPRLSGPADQPRIVQAGDHPVPHWGTKALCSPRGLRGLTSTHGLGRHRLPEIGRSPCRKKNVQVHQVLDSAASPAERHVYLRERDRVGRVLPRPGASATGLRDLTADPRWPGRAGGARPPARLRNSESHPSRPLAVLLGLRVYASSVPGYSA